MSEGALLLGREADEPPSAPPAASPAPSAPPRCPRDPHEHFVEELWVSRRLFETRDFGRIIVDPCAGFGNIVASARACGLSAYGSDIVKRAHGIAGGRDFLGAGWSAPRRAGSVFAIVCNPPFGARQPLLRRFVETALSHARHVAVFAPTRRLNAAGDWLEALPHVETLLLRERSSLWPGAIYAAKLAAGEKLGSGRDGACWLIFDRESRRRPVQSWLRREG